MIDTGFVKASVAYLLVGETRMNMSRGLIREVEEVAQTIMKRLIVVYFLLPIYMILNGRLA